MARLVKVRNVGDSMFTDKCNGAEYTIPPNSEIIVEEDVVSIWMGWPGLVDDPVRKIRDRTDTYRRLRLRYGWHEGMGLTDEDWEQMRPKLEVYDLTDARVWTVLEDPEGTQGNGAVHVTDGSDLASMRAAFDRQQKELEALRRLLEAKDPTSPQSKAAHAAADVEEDTPQVPGPRRKPKDPTDG